MPERFEIYVVYKKHYINTLPFLFLSCNVVVVPTDFSSSRSSEYGCITRMCILRWTVTLTWLIGQDASVPGFA